MPERRKKKKKKQFASAPFDLPSGVVVLVTNWVVETGLQASGALLFKEEPEACHFLQKYPAPTSLISPGSK